MTSGGRRKSRRALILTVPAHKLWNRVCRTSILWSFSPFFQPSSPQTITGCALLFPLRRCRTLFPPSTPSTIDLPSTHSPSLAPTCVRRGVTLKWLSFPKIRQTWLWSGKLCFKFVSTSATNGFLTGQTLFGHPWIRNLWLIYAGRRFLSVDIMVAQTEWAGRFESKSRSKQNERFFQCALGEMVSMLNHQILLLNPCTRRTLLHRRD